MDKLQSESGLAEINNARIYYEIAGEGEPFVMIHAGVADSRQWENEFRYFADRYRVLRYDMRGYGKSEPVEGEYSNLQDLVGLMDHLQIEQPIHLMGCSMGGGLAMDFTLAYPERVKTLIMVSAGPSGLALDVEESPEMKEAQQAYESGDLIRTAELETHIWFDGVGRTPNQVDQDMRRLAYEMNRLGLEHSFKKLGKRLPDAGEPAAGRLGEINVPVLIIVGEHDEPYTHAAADVMVEKIPSAHKVVMDDAAHLPNMDHPEVFRKIVEEFLEG